MPTNPEQVCMETHSSRICHDCHVHHKSQELCAYLSTSVHVYVQCAYLYVCSYANTYLRRLSCWLADCFGPGTSRRRHGSRGLHCCHFTSLAVDILRARHRSLINRQLNMRERMRHALLEKQVFKLAQWEVHPSILGKFQLCN